jgi:tRNA A37 threonylcarbamoyladenosine modification protein TsaB
MDPQPGSFGFALFDGDRELVKTSCPMHGRDAAELPDFVEAQLAQINLKLSDVKRWTVGSGPGSFTFLRVAAALGAGWAAGNDKIRFRCLPGAPALAKALQVADGETVGCIYDGRNKELLCFTVCNNGGKLQPAGEELILTAPAALEYFKKNPMRLAAFPADEAVLKKYLADEVPLEIITPDLGAIAAAPGEFDNDADKMCYIRPAVTTV